MVITHVAYGRLAVTYLREGDEVTAKEYVRKFMELSCQYDHRFYIRLKLIFAPVLKLAVDWGITPEFTREMLVYGGYRNERVYINTLGSFYIAPVHDRLTPIKIRTRKSRELLAYLLEHKEGVTRERIYTDLWGDSEVNVPNLFHARRGEIRRAFESLGASNPILYEEAAEYLKALGYSAKSVGKALESVYGFTESAVEDVLGAVGYATGAISDAIGSIFGSKIICTELHRQGLMSDIIFKADQEFGEMMRNKHPYAMKGYYYLAKPIVELMRKSETFTKAVSFFAIPWANEMAYQMGAIEQGSFAGKLIMLIGLPLCTLVGIIISLPVYVKYSILLLLAAAFLIKPLRAMVIKRKKYSLG